VGGAGERSIQDFKEQHNPKICSDLREMDELRMEEGNQILRNVIAADNTERAYICTVIGASYCYW